MSGVHEPGRPVHCRPKIVTIAFGRLAGVQTHPHPQADPHRPLLPIQRSLGIRRRIKSLPRPVEHGREPVPASGKHITSVRLDRPPDKGVMTGQGHSHPLRCRLPQTRRTLDVTEQEGDSSRRSPHRTNPSTLRRAAPATAQAAACTHSANSSTRCALHNNRRRHTEVPRLSEDSGFGFSSACYAPPLIRHVRDTDGLGSRRGFWDALPAG